MPGCYEYGGSRRSRLLSSGIAATPPSKAGMPDGGALTTKTELGSRERRRAADSITTRGRDEPALHFTKSTAIGLRTSRLSFH